MCEVSFPDCTCEPFLDKLSNASRFSRVPVICISLFFKLIYYTILILLVISSNFDYELLGVSQKWKDFLRKPIGEKKIHNTFVCTQSSLSP